MTSGDHFQNFIQSYAALPAVGLDTIKEEKIKLITGIETASSIRDYGGLWGVHGLYLIEGAKGLRCGFAQMVNRCNAGITPVEQYNEKVAEAQETLDCEFNFYKGDFRDTSIFYHFEKVDVSLLYEVILHQENYVQVIKNVIEKTNSHICFAQPMMKETLFTLPCSSALLQFYPEELKDLIRYANWWDKEPPVETFDTRYWMWGQSISHIRAVFQGFGWEVAFQKVFEMSDHWVYALMRFAPKNLK